MAYAYREGALSFFEEVFRYLLENNPTETFELHGLNNDPFLPMIELVLGNTGTVSVSVVIMYT